MKKIIPLFFVLLCLFGCSKESSSPDLTADFNFTALYKTGDFSFSCKIKSSESGIYVTPVSTNAAGMTMFCNGKEVRFSRGNLEKSFNFSDTRKTNPAVLLFEISSAVKAGEITEKKEESGVKLLGKCSLGDFEILLTDGGKIEKIEVKDAEIVINNAT